MTNAREKIFLPLDMKVEFNNAITYQKQGNLIEAQKKYEYILESYSYKKLLTISISKLASFSFIGIVSYRVSNYLIYGRLIKKIDEMIDELDLLKK